MSDVIYNVVMPIDEAKTKAIDTRATYHVLVKYIADNIHAIVFNIYAGGNNCIEQETKDVVLATESLTIRYNPNTYKNKVRITTIYDNYSEIEGVTAILYFLQVRINKGGLPPINVQYV